MKFTTEGLYASRRSPVMARNIVSTSQPLAAQAGLRMLAQGGNAADAALAAAIALPVVEPTGNGLGSDAYAIIWDGTEIHGLNASGRAPAAWSPERFAGQEKMPQRGWEAVTVPGAVSAWRAISDKFGKLPFEKLFEPAIEYASRGFAVSPIIAQLWANGAKVLHDKPGFAEAFMPGGRTPKAGELFVNSAMAESLRDIAETGGDSFYKGRLAKKIADFARQHGAALNEEDLANHKADWCGTISQEFGDVALHEIPPNGQGISALMALGILRHCQIDQYGPDDPEALHLEIEAMKLAFADLHTYVADLDHMRDVTVEHLLSDKYLASRAALIDPAHAQDFKAGAPEHGGTVYVTAADENGMMVSFIQSNYLGFGSGVVVPGTSISLQNRGHGFSLQPGHPNLVAGGKRPFQTIIPAFLMGKDGNPVMSFGVMGGPMQAQGHLQMTLRTQLWGQDPQTAADAPRWQAISGLDVAVEHVLGDETIKALRAKGHNVLVETPDQTNFGFGGAQLIAKTDAGYVAGSDPRKDGCAVGF
ncbi:gamma-glutamyltransferase family protein [Thalassospira sp. MCCC 1A01428]|uniref:gamma-glutamyltransferase family protein n=1 Tax=Thalassospira sp. MCCC 1A01428 TaxID=1470575 RepID=UPI000A1F7D95|nr:gamma-glutamyltransferase family protein [Thalassospira sp. MCCC 1A01428]OSQ43979.1 gamma-glutamyltransferase [Thalassospira sp. MCCC 1A01428]